MIGKYINKLHIYLIISVLSTHIAVFSQNDSSMLIPYLKNGKYGFANEKAELIIKDRYSFALPFFADNELTTVVRNSKSYIINRNNSIILKNASSDFFTSVHINSMNILPYTSVEDIAIDRYCMPDINQNFFLIAAPDKLRLFDKINNLYMVRKHNKVFLIDTQANIKSKFYDRIQHFDNKLIEYCVTKDFINNKYGLLNNKAEEALSCMYDNILYRGNDRFTVFLFGGQHDINISTKNYKDDNIIKNNTRNYKIKINNKKRGIVDKADKIIVECKYDRLYYLNDKKFVFIKNDSIGIIDINEKIYYLQTNQNIDRKYKNYAIVNENFVFFRYSNKWRLINLYGQQTGDAYDGVFIDFQNVMNGMTGVVNNNKLGVINSIGKLIIDTKCDTIYGLRENSSFVVKENDSWNWINSKGEYIYKDFDNFNYLIAGYLLVRKNEKWFYVNDKGKEFYSE